MPAGEASERGRWEKPAREVNYQRIPFKLEFIFYQRIAFEHKFINELLWSNKFINELLLSNKFINELLLSNKFIPSSRDGGLEKTRLHFNLT